MQQWFIRLNNETIGPLNTRELRDLAVKGTVCADTPISNDGRTWCAASNVQGLKLGSGADRSKKPSQVAKTVSASAFPIVWVLSAIGVLLVALLIVGAISTHRPPQSAHTGIAQDSATAIPSVGEQTYAYWTEIARTLGEYSQAHAADPPNVANQLRTTADYLERLPAAGVDPDAVNCALDLALFLRESADVGERGNDPSILVEAFLRGAAGDPYGLTVEMLNSQRALQQRLQAVQQRAVQSRAMLSSRYGVEFPPL